MAKSNLTIPVRVKVPMRRVRFGAWLAVRLGLIRLGVWVVNSAVVRVKVGNRDWTEQGRFVATLDE